MEYHLQLLQLSKEYLQRMVHQKDRSIPTADSLARGVVIETVEYNPRAAAGMTEGRVTYRDGTTALFRRTKRSAAVSEWANIPHNGHSAVVGRKLVPLESIGNPIDKIDVVMYYSAMYRPELRLFGKATAKERYDYRKVGTHWEVAVEKFRNVSEARDYAIMLEWLEVFNTIAEHDHKSELRAVASAIGDVGMILDRILPDGEWSSSKHSIVLPPCNPWKELKKLESLCEDNFKNKIVLSYSS